MQAIDFSPTHMAQRLAQGGALLPDSPENTTEVVGILKSYGVVLAGYNRNLTYIAEQQFLELFPFFKYMNGAVSWASLRRHWWHERLNYEFAEYCMRCMLWHGGGGIDRYLDTEEFKANAARAIAAKVAGNPFMQALDRLFPDFLPEQVRQLCYYSALGTFWSVMAEMFLNLSDRYDQGEIKSIADVVNHILQALVQAANLPVVYQVEIQGQTYPIMPPTAGLTFLTDAAVPYVETVFFRSFPFRGTVTYNAQEEEIPRQLSKFKYGALYADPLPIGGAGIPPTLLMQDMRHYLPDYIFEIYAQRSQRGQRDLRGQICVSFQKSMFCVTTAAILGLAPQPLGTDDPIAQAQNLAYFQQWCDRLADSRLAYVQ
ncbi:MAG: CO2 hydration protein [Pseudanabaenaceae cyanobacterium bins.68]|nr:CO2 hydration protein [Pseudanabaenaceae cyanobacterium bins.68]